MSGIVAAADRETPSVVPCACVRAGADPSWEDLPAGDREFLRTSGLVRLTAAAHMLGVSPGSLRRHVHEGRCAARKFDGEWFVGRATVERWALRRRLRLRG